MWGRRQREWPTEGRVRWLKGTCVGTVTLLTRVIFSAGSVGSVSRWVLGLVGPNDRGRRDDGGWVELA